MKKIIFFALLSAGLASCSNDENEVQETPQATEAATQKLSKTEIVSKYGKAKAEDGLQKARLQFAIDCKIYLADEGINTDGLNDNQIINLFMQKF